MRRSVLDTSALMRLYVPDGPVPDGLEAAVDAAWRGDAVLLAPELLLAETAQVLWKKEQRGLLGPDESRDVLAAVLALPLTTVGHRELLPAARGLARDHGLTVYDALYLALARQQAATLFSSDERLLRVASLHSRA